MTVFMLDIINFFANLSISLIIIAYFSWLVINKISSKALREKAHARNLIIMMIVLGATLSSTKIINNAYIEIASMVVCALLGWVIIKFIKKREHE